MFKNLLKKNMIVIFGVALLCSILVAYSFIRSSSSTSSFEQSGYVHVDINESEDKRVLFSGGQKYKNIVDSKIKFSDSASKERKIASDNFIHYDDDSIAAFKDGVIVNVGELTAETSTMNHFYISPGMALRNTGSSYTAGNSGQEIDFSDFLWKISENKYLAISKSISANFSETDQRDCGTYAEITYLDGKVIQIQTDDNVWQTISGDTKLILNDGSIIDLAMKNIKDQNGNVLLDFSRIIIDPNANIELTPMDAEMESINKNIIPRFVVNNTPGDAGADGTSGGIGLRGTPGNQGGNGDDGDEGSSQTKEDAVKSEKQFPIFYVMDWKVTPNSCHGQILVDDYSDVLIKSDSTGLASKIYLVDLETGQNIYLPDNDNPSAFQFAKESKKTEKGEYPKDPYTFTFTGLQSDHSYMLYVSAPIKMSDETAAYSRGFVSKTFWTDSSGVYIEDAAVDTNSYQIVAHTNNINGNIGVYTFKYPFEDYDAISSLTLSKIKNDYSAQIIDAPIWKVNNDPNAEVIAGSYTFEPFTSYLGFDRSNTPMEIANEDGTSTIKSNTHYYTMLLYDLDGDKTIDDYSTYILDTLTLKLRPTVAPPSLETNKTIGGFDITPGIVTDEDAAVTNYAIEIYSLDHIDTSGGEASKYVVLIDSTTGKPYEPDKIINLKNNSPASVSMGGLKTSDYVSREVLTVFDNEKEYYVYSGFSNSSHLEESVQPMVYFQPFGEQDPGEEKPLTELSPYYDSCVGILHIYPGSNGYMYLVNEGSTIRIDGDNYSYNFLLDPVGKGDSISINGDKTLYDGAKFPAITRANGQVDVYFLDYANENKSWMSGLKPNSEYYVTVYGDLYTDPSADLTNPDNIVKHMTTVGKCTVKTPPTTGLHFAMSSSPSSPNILKNLSMAIASPSQLRSSLNKPLANNQEESYYNRQLETFYGFKVTAYLNDYSEEMKYLPSTDEKIVDGKTYYTQGAGNVYTEVNLKLDDNKNKKPNEAWYEYKEVPLKESDYWFSKTFTNDELWKTGKGEDSWQVYMLYDFESFNDLLKTGVQVVGVPDDKGVETYVYSSNGTVNLDDTKWKYPYLAYNKETGLPVSEDPSNRITSEDVKGGGLRFKVRPLHKLDSLFSASIERGRNTANSTIDYVVSSGGMLFDDSIFDDVLGETLEKAVLGEEGVIKKKGAIGVTFIIEELFDYTGNPDESSLEKQQSVKVPTKDEYLEYDEDGVVRKAYFSKNGDLYTRVDFENLNPSQLGLLARDSSTGTVEYVPTTDTKIVYGFEYYYLYKGGYYQFDSSDIMPSHLGLYESANHYVNYFENSGEKRIYIPFSRNIGDINLELPYNTDPSETQGKIERHTVSENDEYHYYYTAQANFLNSNLLADTITYRIYDSVDFYNTQKHLNNDKEYVNWALLGKDPRITNPTDLFTDTWVIQDVQTIDESPKGEYVYQQIKGIDGTEDKGLERIQPYAYGWYEKTADGKYVLTKDVNIEGSSKYYINKGENSYELLDTSSFSPAKLKWYEEKIELETNDYIEKNKTYYVQTLVQSVEGGSTVEYNLVDPENISPSSFCWYEYNSTLSTYTLSNDTAISPDANKTYYYFNGSTYTPISADIKKKAADGDIHPVSLGWSFGNKTLTTSNEVKDGDRYFVKYLINVHSTDELSSGAFTNYDTCISPVENAYKEKAKVLAVDDTEVVAGRRYYTQYFNEKNQACYKLIDITANEYKTVKNPSAAGWFKDDDSADKILSFDKYFDVEKEYFTSSGDSVNSSINPATQGWFEKSKQLSTDTLIDYSKSYFAKKGENVYSDKINPNINPSQLNWYEVAKKPATGTYNNGTNYYALRGDSYVPVGTPINPSAIGWYEAKKVASDDSVLSPTTTYFVRILDENWAETFKKFDKDNVNPSELKWREKDEVNKEKFVSTDSEVMSGKKYYIPVGQNNYAEYVGGGKIEPEVFGLFVEERSLSSDTEANSSKTYYSSLTDTNPINTNSLDLSKLNWYVDDASAAKIVSQDQTYNRNKIYYPDASSPAISLSAPFNPNKLMWYEDKWVPSTDTSINPNKEYAIRYLTNPKASSAVTTEGLELAKITLSFNNLPNNTPTIFFFPCTYEYAKLHYSEVLNTASNCVFLDDDSFEELYGHQFIITWTINYHHYMSEEINGAWHLIFPFDASAKLAPVSEAGTAGNVYDATFATMAETNEGTKFSSVVAYFYNNPSALPNGLDTVFGKNAYMAVPHNYIELDEPKQAPTAYALQWDSGTELSNTGISNKFVTTRVLVNDPYNSTFNYKADSSSTNYHAYTNAYVVPDKQSNSTPTLLEEVRINNAPGNIISSNIKAIEDIVSVDSSTMITNDADKYAIGEVKISDKAVSHDAVNGFIDANGLGYVPAVLPIQLYSNKYVAQKESLHIASDNSYVKGSSEVGSDSNWTFVKNPDGKTLNKDKFAPLFTAFFNDDVDTSTLTDQSIMKLKPHIENQELKGYDVELIAPPEAVKDAVGVRLRFEIHDYREASAIETSGSPAYAGDQSLGLYEAQMIKKDTTDTVPEEGKTYYWQVGFKYYEYRIDNLSTTSTTKVTPNEYGWYVEGEEPNTYVATTDTWPQSGTTYYYLKKDTTDNYVKINDPYKLNPSEVGLLDETYNDVKWTEDTSAADKKYLYQTNDVLYSMAIDKYLPMAGTDTPSYNKDEEAKLLGLKKESDGSIKLHMYFAIAAEELDFDDEYGIDTALDRSFNGKDGIRVYANYLYESDKGGYSYLTNSVSGNPSFSKRADSIINNKMPGAFSIRSHRLMNVNNNYYLEADPSSRQYSSFVARPGGSANIITVPENVYTVDIPEAIKTYDGYKLNRFGSFFSVAECFDDSTSTHNLLLKTTRYLSPDSSINFTQTLPIDGIVAHDQQVFIPSLLTTSNQPQIKVVSWKMNKYFNENNPADYGIMQFPKSNLYIAFRDGTLDDGSAVSRQQSKLDYQIFNADSSHKIYALVTKQKVDVNADRTEYTDETYDTYAFNRTRSTSSDRYTVISEFKKDNSVIQTQIRLQDILNSSSEYSNPTDYFSKMDINHKLEGAKYSDLFIPVYGNGVSNLESITLEALPYNSSYSVSFWVWSLIGETADGSEYGWVSVPYSSLRTNSATIDFETKDTPQTSLESCVVKYGIGENHTDGYINKSLTTNIHNGSPDLYYVVDLIDNETNSLITHLYATEGQDHNPRTYDLDGIVGSDDSGIIYKTTNDKRILGVNGTSLKVIPSAGDEPYNSFKYGKLENGNDRYKIVLHTYIRDHGPATLGNPNDYDFTKDEDSAYLIYRFIRDEYGNTVKDTNPDHILKKAVSNLERSFSINKDFDMLEKTATNIAIQIDNGTNIKRSDLKNGPNIVYTINKPDYHSYSLAYEKYIPVFVRTWTENSVQKYDNITEKVFSDKLYGENNKEGGTSAGNGYYIFDFDNPKTIKMSADTNADITSYNETLKNGLTNYGLNVNDTVTIFLLSLQDVLEADQNYLLQFNGEHTTNAADVSQTNIEGLLAQKVKELAADPASYANGGKLYTTTRYENAKGEELPVYGLRMVSARYTKVNSKLIIIDPAHVFGSGTYTDEQLAKFAKVKTLTEQRQSLGQMMSQDQAEFDKDCKALTDAVKAYNDATTEAEKNKWLKERKDKARQELKLLGMTDEEADAFIEERAANYEDNYNKVVLNKLQLDIDKARIKLGRVQPDANAALTYYRESKIPTSENQKPEDAATYNTTIDYDETTGLPRDDKITILTKDSANVTHVPGSADRLHDVLGEISRIDKSLSDATQDLDNNSKRSLTFSLKIDSKTLGEFGDATVDIYLGDTHVTPTFKKNKILIVGEKIDNLYGFTWDFNPEEQNKNYDTVKVTVQLHETNNNVINVFATSAIGLCNLQISEIEYQKSGTETEEFEGRKYTYTTYSASQKAASYVCTSATNNNNPTNPTITYIFEKK